MILLQYVKLGKTSGSGKKKETKLSSITGILKQVNMGRLFNLSSNTRIKGH